MQQAYSLLPHLKITELLLEVDSWTDFAQHFKHLKSGEPAEDQHLLLTAILADAINLGLSKMAESCPGTTYAKLTWSMRSSVSLSPPGGATPPRHRRMATIWLLMPNPSKR